LAAEAAWARTFPDGPYIEVGDARWFTTMGDSPHYFSITETFVSGIDRENTTLAISENIFGIFLIFTQNPDGSIIANDIFIDSYQVFGSLVFSSRYVSDDVGLPSKPVEVQSYSFWSGDTLIVRTEALVRPRQYSCGEKTAKSDCGLLGFTDVSLYLFGPESELNRLSVRRRGSGFLLVPEPASWAMMIAGFGLVGGALRRRREQMPA
jgi:hypothetical protein